MKDASSTISIIGCLMIIGMVTDLILQYLYTNTIIINALVTTDMTLASIQIFVVFFFVMIGVWISASD